MLDIVKHKVHYGCMNRLPLETRARILGCLTEGMSLRATSRLVDVSINTVTKLLVEVGTACEMYQLEHLKDLKAKRIQCDEIWSFVGAKEANTPPNVRGQLGRGDVYTWVALDADSKLVVSWLVGKRNTEYAVAFMKDVAARLANRVQLTTDGHKGYLSAVEGAFGIDVDYAMLAKLYGGDQGNKATAEHRYSPGKCIGQIKGVVTGNPDMAHVSTAHVERQNLTMRMQMRRFTRLTNAFSKKIENHAHAVALHYMFYNFARIHKTLRVTPAMQAGVSDHVWSLEEIARLAD
jgi:IS1 family transposase